MAVKNNPEEQYETGNASKDEIMLMNKKLFVVGSHATSTLTGVE